MYKLKKSLYCLIILMSKLLLIALLFVTTITCDDSRDKNIIKIIEPKIEIKDKFKIVWLSGTPYEMGKQHGEFLHDEIKVVNDFIDNDPILSLAEPIAESNDFLNVIDSNSYEDIKQECEGLVSATADTGFTMNKCMITNFLDVLKEFLFDNVPDVVDTNDLTPGCSQLIVSNSATTDGKLYHARIMDWMKIDYVVNNPVIFVRQPKEGIPHAYIGFPSNISPFSGININGIVVASAEAAPFDSSFHDLKGRSHVQMNAQILKKASNLDEAIKFIKEQDHMSAEIIVVSDAKSKKAAVFEMTSKVIGIREMDNDHVLYATNHFEGTESAEADSEVTAESSLIRFERLKQLASKDGKDTKYGNLNSETLIEIMRDRINPFTGEEHSVEIFDNNQSLATNGALFMIVFDPENLHFWVAAGGMPVSSQPFTGFSLGQLLELPDALAVNPAIYE